MDEVFAEKEISADDSVRLIDQIVEEMDLRPLMRAYFGHWTETGDTAADIIQGNGICGDGAYLFQLECLGKPV